MNRTTKARMRRDLRKRMEWKPIPQPDALRYEARLDAKNVVLCRRVFIKERFVGYLAFQSGYLPFRSRFMTRRGGNNVVLKSADLDVYHKLGLFKQSLHDVGVTVLNYYCRMGAHTKCPAKRWGSAAFVCSCTCHI